MNRSIRVPGAKNCTGNYNPGLLAELFHEQSQLWPEIAQAHIVTIRAIVSEWIEMAICSVIHDSEQSLRNEVGNIWQDWLDSSEKLALEELDKLLEDERRDPLTYNHYYTDNIQKSRAEVQRDAMRDILVPWMTGHSARQMTTAMMENLVSGIGSETIVDIGQAGKQRSIDPAQCVLQDKWHVMVRSKR